MSTEIDARGDSGGVLATLAFGPHFAMSQGEPFGKGRCERESERSLREGERPEPQDERPRTEEARPGPVGWAPA